MQILDQLVSSNWAGNRDAACLETGQGELFAAVYKELRRIAGAHMRLERFGHTIQATALVHETFLKLSHHIGLSNGTEAIDRQYFLGIASQAMRRILVDRARARIAKKRDAGDYGKMPFCGFANPSQFIDLHNALGRLALVDPRHATIVEMRFFGGLKDDEIAEALGICSRTVKRDWKVARAWLYGELTK